MSSSSSESVAISSHPVDDVRIAASATLPSQRTALDGECGPPASTSRQTLGERIIRMERGWFTDFAWRDGGVVVRKTGATTPLDATVLGHVFTWLRYFFLVRAIGFGKRLSGRGGPAIWFSPEMPRPWYMIRSATGWAGMRVATDPALADIAFHFDDSTWSPPAAAFAGPTINYACLDISKSRVNAIFADVFGYDLGINSSSWSGLAVEKSEANGMHDGRIVICPTLPIAGRCYQRLVVTSVADEVRDLRTTCIDGRPVQTWIKTRSERDRFSSGANNAVRACAPSTVFSPAEIANIGAFCVAIGLEWGTLDILRDAGDGRIYIVDVNKTDVGPVLQLSIRDKIASTRAISAALLRLIADRASRTA